MANDKEIIRTNKAPHSPAYSQAVKAAGLIFVAGQGSFNPETGAVVTGCCDDDLAMAECVFCERQK